MTDDNKKVFLDDSTLASIEARANAATPIGERCPEKLYLFANDSDLIAQIRSYHAGNSDNDYEFYYHARTDIPALVAALRSARAEVMRLRAEHAYMDSAYNDFAVKKENELRAAREALRKIGYVASYVGTGRDASYADWELRLIARKALGEE